MSFDRFIHEYLDGELEQTQQDVLFAEMSHNSELRSEFQQQLKLHMIAQNDMATITPPAESANMIFSKLGFTIPPTDYLPPAGSASKLNPLLWGAALWNFSRKYSANMFFTLLTAGLTALIIWWMQGGSFGDGRNDYAGNYPVMTSVEQSAAIDGFTSKTDGSAGVLPGGTNMDQKSLEKYLNSLIGGYFRNFENNFYSNLGSNLTQRTESQGKNYADDYTDGSLNNNGFGFMLSNLNMNRPILSNKPESILSAKDISPVIMNNGDTRMSLQVRSYSAIKQQELSVPDASSPWFNNVALSLNYNFDRMHSAGAEIGQEAFVQEFNNVLYGEQLHYTQKPTLFWYGAYYRMNMQDLVGSSVIYPYSQVFAGATSNGPLARLQAGIQYKPDKRVTFTLGGEASYLWYNVQGTVYNTSKYGITYGVSLNY